MENLQYIEVSKIHPHPGNPRKDLGDLSELAESIKVNGIFQNLTVVPLVLVDPDATVKLGNDHYTVVIGHRRLAAAAIAGLDKVPCVVADLNEREQARTMLMENMQRSDLTIYEQAQGFQMMLDLGDTMEEIVQHSGFSKKTVRQRLKLLELDPKKFKKSVERGATIQDYMELEQIEDPELKNKVLDAIGTNNFRNALKDALDAEKLKKALEKWEAVVCTFAQKIEKRGKVDGADVPMDYHKNLHRWCMDEEVKKPEDADTVKYYYTINDREIDIYRDHKEHVKTPEELQRDQQREESARVRGELNDISEKHRSLRREFIANYGAAKKNIKTIVQFLAAEFIAGAGDWISADEDALHSLLGIEIDDDTMDDDLMQMAKEAASERPEYSLLVCAYAMVEDTNENYWGATWDTTQRRTIFVHSQNDNLDRLYDFLTALGYQMSDEEKAMRDGTHELFKALGRQEEPSRDGGASGGPGMNEGGEDYAGDPAGCPA